MTQPVIIIHGIFSKKIIMTPLAKRLSKDGREVLNIQYNTFAINMDDIFDKIDKFLETRDKATIIGWSLGGLIARTYLENKSKNSSSIKRVITLGTPHTGSSVATKLTKYLPSNLIPRSVEILLVQHDTWHFNIPLHSIAGNLPIGMFSYIATKDSDSAVEIEETKINGMSTFDIFPVTHLGLIFSKRVTSRVKELLEL